jgi:5-dehydro-2-deoxygluconokinase
VGRTIFQDVARAWFADGMSDADAVKAMAANFSRLADAWQGARTAVAV